MPHGHLPHKTGISRCFQAPEILQLICAQLPIDRTSDRQRLLAFALSCKAILEPALDRLWFKIPSFRPIMTTLPADLWKAERKPGPNSNRYTLLTLQRAVTAVDLERYIAYYSYRIREVEIGILKATFSAEAWQGLQLATRWTPGALSPSAQRVAWSLTTAKQVAVPQDALNQAFPYFSLFLGPATTRVQFTFDSGPPDIPLKLKRLKLKDFATYSATTPFAGTYLQSSSWDNLEVLRLANIPESAIPHLSTLPRLASLEFWRLSMQPRHTYTQEHIERPPGHLRAMADNGFRSLETLRVTGDKGEDVVAFLQHLSPKNRLRVLKCTLTDHSVDIDHLILTIRLHCNPDYLRKLVVKGSPGQLPTSYEESLNITVDGGLNIRPLEAFNQLQTLSINLQSAVNLTVGDIAHIIVSFSNLIKLKIDTRILDSRFPTIDHNQLLELMYNLPNLKKLGLRFNATLITGDEVKPESTIRNLPPAIEKLWVADSPIYSPDAVGRFLAKHCPKLRTSNVIHPQLDHNAMPSYVPLAVYHRRWKAVGIQ
ncbi:hypothetical protein DFP72DRAFT_908466 [Ephemerocybe angulata]|uniref:F-box domain-containing protein n=1 Tax=Ephemerocybe angulata TaxID=980116 RepID=A0A8H6HSP9_9AGAR|nr:hypothetical protein DFP72DRAFT_908466 [Tulosesus angulatus]